ncbi:ATP-binding protein [Sesbania bispinosa]|nr:ATP-binding protein [Sesbania bispinosa]
MAGCSLDFEWESGGSATTSLQVLGSIDSSLHADSEAASSDGVEPVVETTVNRGKRKAFGFVSGKRRLKPEELRTRGEGEFEGYFI